MARAGKFGLRVCVSSCVFFFFAHRPVEGDRAMLDLAVVNHTLLVESHDCRSSFFFSGFLLSDSYEKQIIDLLYSSFCVFCSSNADDTLSSSYTLSNNNKKSVFIFISSSMYFAIAITTALTHAPSSKTNKNKNKQTNKIRNTARAV